MVEISGTSTECCPTKHHSRWWDHRAVRAGSLQSRIWNHSQRARSSLFKLVWWVWPFCSAFQNSPPVRTREQSYFSQSSSLHPMGVFPLEGGWPLGRPQVMTTQRNAWLCCFECSLITLSPPMKQPHPQDIKTATVKVLHPVCPYWTHAAFC